MTEAQIRQIVKSELAASAATSRFNLNSIPRHTHNGVDSPPISQNDILAGNTVVGSIAFAQATTYNIGVNFNPTTIVVHGNVIGDTGQRFITVGNAQFGPSLYLQPGTSTSVVPGGTPQTIVQSCTYFGAESAGGALHTLVDEGHIVDIFYASTIFARATITSVSNKGIAVTVSTLASGWTMNLAWTIS